MTPELSRAIERVERFAAAQLVLAQKPKNSPFLCDYYLDLAEALRTVLARAKEPRVYALGAEERYALNVMLDNQRKRKDGWASAGDVGMVANCDLYIDALTAALALEKIR